MERADDRAAGAPGAEGGMTSADPQTRYEVEELFFKEAALLDEWRLEEWLELLTEDATYHVPPTDSRDGDARTTLFIIADDALRIRSRVKQLLGKSAFAHAPHDKQCAGAGRRRREYPRDRELCRVSYALRIDGYLRRALRIQAGKAQQRTQDPGAKSDS